MTEPDELVGVGSPVQLSPQSTRFRCRACDGPVWMAPPTLAHMRKIGQGRKLQFLCLDCLKREPEGEVQPLDPGEVAALRAAGVDMTAEQINAFSQELIKKLRRR